jgi:hypothetical protein
MDNAAKFATPFYRGNIMSTFSPAVSMKRRSTRFVAAAMTSGLLAVGLAGGGSAAANPVNISCVSGIGNIVCNSLNNNTILTIHTGDILSQNEINSSFVILRGGRG